MNSLICCYFPSQVIFVDDDIRILKSVRAVVDDQLANYKFYDDPYAALDYIDQLSDGKSFLFQALQSPLEDRVYDIYKEIYNHKRFEEISIVIVDYDMPGINGLDFCEKIKNPAIRKILYTGVADEQLAINAFNTGIIDGYIRKHDPQIENTLNTLIKINQFKYFMSITEMHVGNFFKELLKDDPKATAFYDPAFITYFNDFIKQHDIIEYYLNESVGGFVCLNAKGKVSVLFVYSEETFEQNKLHIQEILEEKSVSKKQISAKLLKSLTENKATICFPFTGKNLHPGPNTWKNYTYPIEKIIGNQIYYVAYATNIKYINVADVYSFEQYKKSQ